MMILTALLGIGFIFALAGDFVLWAKLDEQKHKTAEEYNRRWDEISRAVGLENEIAFWKEANEDKAKDILYYHEHCKKQADALKLEMERTSRLDRDNAQLEQSLRSALRCPNNDHVWKDGFCVKCGRVKDD